jgi:hypothetical protein
MNLEFKHLLPDNFSPGSKVWIYQSSRIFSLSEAFEAEDMIHKFIDSWQSHGAPVKGAGHLFFGQFIILMADETATSVGGCSTDSSVRLIKEIEQKMGVSMFDRTSLAFVIKDRIQLLPLSQLQYAFDNGFINGDTLYFNNLVYTKKELENNWIVTINNSWLKNKISLSKPVS